MEPAYKKELEIFLEKLKKNATVLEFQKVQEEVLKNSQLLETIAYFHTLEPYDPQYKEIKHLLFQNESYRNYLSLHQELTYWTFEMSKKLKEYLRNDNHENH